MWGPISALQTLDCDWSAYNFIEVNFSKLMDNNIIFWDDFVCIHYHLCKISSLPMIFLNDLSITHSYIVTCSTTEQRKNDIPAFTLLIILELLLTHTLIRACRQLQANLSVSAVAG